MKINYSINNKFGKKLNIDFVISNNEWFTKMCYNDPVSSINLCDYNDFNKMHSFNIFPLLEFEE